MEDTCWRILYDELSSEITITSKDDIQYVGTLSGELPVNQFKRYLSYNSSVFIGECRRNIEENNQVPPFFNDLLYKLEFLFSHQFYIHFPPEGITYPLHYGELIIPFINSTHDPYISVVHTKIHCFSMAIIFLRQQLNPQAQPKSIHRIRTKADIRDFRTTSLNTAQLSEILKIGKRLGLFSRDTNQKVFVDIFSGRPATNPINWTCTIFSLTRFINGINGKSIYKLTDGKWYVVSQLFVVDNHKIEEDSLLHPSIGKNDELDKVDTLISYFNSPDQLED